MIKANELRSGNIVVFPPYTHFEVSGVSIMKLEERLVNFEPIPLTSEWLERCGFYNLGIKEYPRWVHSKIDDYFDGRQFCHDFGDEEYFCFGECEHLHQLQNLFFALTGTELEIKMK